MEKDSINMGITHVGIRSHNFEKTVKLYEEGFGFKVVTSWEWGEKGKAYIMDTGDGCCIEIGNDGDESTPPIGKFSHIALKTDDIQASYERAIKAGARPKVPPTFSDIVQAKPKPWRLWFAYVIGFDNEEFEFIQDVEDED